MTRELQGHTALQGRQRRGVERLPAGSCATGSPPPTTSTRCSTSPTQQRADLDACMGKFRVSVTPYYASLMDPDDPRCPVRMQAVPIAGRAGHPPRGPQGRRQRGLRLADAAHHASLPRPRALRGHRDVQHVLPPLHAPAPGRRHRGHGRADRDRQRHQVHRALPRGARRADQRRRPAGALRRPARGHHQARARHPPRRDHPHRHARAGRLPAAHHPRAGGDAQEVPAALHQHALQPPQGVHAREQAGLRHARRRRHPAGQPDGAHARHQRLRQRHEEARRTSCVEYRVKPYYYYQCDLAEGTAHFRTSVAKGIEIYESLRGHTTGFAVPTYIIDAIGGGGKTPVFPNYVISQAPRPDHPAQLRGRDQQVHGARGLRRGRVPLRGLRGREASGSAWPACSTATARRCSDVWDGAHAEGRRPQEPHGRRLRPGQGLRQDAEEQTCPESSSSPSG